MCKGSEFGVVLAEKKSHWGWNRVRKGRVVIDEGTEEFGPTVSDKLCGFFSEEGRIVGGYCNYPDEK